MFQLVLKICRPSRFGGTQIMRDLSTVPNPESLLFKYRKYLQSKKPNVNPLLKELLAKNRLFVMKNHRDELMMLLTSAKPEELPYLAYLTYKCYDRELQQLFMVRLQQLQHTSNLSFRDIGIICNTVFVSKVSVENVVLIAEIAKRLKEDIAEIGLNREQVTVIKLLRKLKFYDCDTEAVLLSKLESDCCSLSLIDIIHVLAWIVDCEIAFFPLSPKVIENIVVKLENAGSSVRCKDIDRLLWILTFQPDVPEILVNKLVELLHIKKSDSDLTVLMLGNMLLSLAILGRYEETLTGMFLSDTRLAEVHKVGMDRSRQLSRVGLFLEALSIEADLSSLHRKNIGKVSAIIQAKGVQEMDMTRELQFIRKGVVKVQHALDLYSKNMRLTDVRVEQQIPYLSLSGVTFKMKSDRKETMVAVEVIDKHTWVARSVYKPGRLLRFKGRLLGKLGWAVIFVTEPELLSSREQICQIVERKLKRIGA